QERLERLLGEDGVAAACALLDLSQEFASDRTAVAQALNLRDEEVVAVFSGIENVVAVPDARAPEFYTTAAKLERLEAAVCEAVAAAHRTHPLAPGVEMESLRGQLPWD